MATIEGTAGDDTLAGTTSDDTIIGGDGNDTLFANDNSIDLLAGGAGDDVFVINWNKTPASDSTRTIIEDNLVGDAADWGTDTLDMSRVAAGLGHLAFHDETGGGLRISVWSEEDSQGNYVGGLLIPNQYGDDGTAAIEILVVGDVTIDLTTGGSAGGLVSVLTYGVSDAPDVITLTEQFDEVYTLGGDDTLIAEADYIDLFGGDGNDRLFVAGEAGLAYLAGGDGNDHLSGGRGLSDFYGHDGDDTLRAGGIWDRLFGGAGDDLLVGAGQQNGIVGGEGDDTLRTGDASGSNLEGGAGDDLFILDEGGLGARVRDSSASTEGSGNDTLDVSAYAENSGQLYFSGVWGSDLRVYFLPQSGEAPVGSITLEDHINPYGFFSVETILTADGNGVDITSVNSAAALNQKFLYKPTTGDDSITGTWFADQIRGGDGDDVILGHGHLDLLSGGAGADTLRGGDGADTLWGGRDDQSGDLIEGGQDDDVIGGGAGDDSLYGGADNDLVFGGSGRDLLSGGDGDDILFGGDGRDQLFGGYGADTLFGGGGSDRIEGRAGNDRIISGDGSDRLVFRAGDGSDLVTDFSLASDILDLSATATDFTDLASVQAAVSTTAAGLQIHLGGGDSVTLQGLTLDDVASLTLVLD